MKNSEKWDRAYNDRNRDGLSELVDKDFHFIRHSTGEKIPRERILDMQTTKDRVVIRSQRVVYDSDEILVQHWFMDWPNGTKDAVLTVMLFKNGKATKMELASTPLPQ